MPAITQRLFSSHLFHDSIIYSVVLSCFVMLVKSFPWLKLMIKTPTNGTIKLTLPCTKGIDWFVCEESRWVDYMLALNILLGNR